MLLQATVQANNYYQVTLSNAKYEAQNCSLHGCHHSHDDAVGFLKGSFKTAKHIKC